MARERVLIGFADALAAVESAWSLTDDGFEVLAFARRGTKPPLGASRAVRIVYVTAPESDIAACARELAEIVGEFDPAVVLPLDDNALWVCGQVEPPLPLAGPTGHAAEFTFDKREQIKAAEAAGFDVPAQSANGPWIVKPALAVVEQDNRLLRPTGRIARTTEEVEEVSSRIEGPVIVQDVVSGVGEGVFGLATDDGIRAWSAHRRIRMMNPRGSGSSACRSIPVDEPVREAAERLMTGLGWRGLFMVELLRDHDGVPWFMEVNGRPWGSMALAVGRGYPYPAWAVRQVLDSGFTPTVPENAPDLLCRHLGREVVHLAAVMRGAKGADADAGLWPKRGATLLAMRPRRGDHWYNWRRSEAGVFFRDTWSTMAGQLLGRS